MKNRYIQTGSISASVSGPFGTQSVSMNCITGNITLENETSPLVDTLRLRLGPDRHYSTQYTSNIDYGQYKCTKCKNDVIGKDIALQYTYINVDNDRTICKDCLAEALDKMLGLDINAALERTLFEKPAK